MMLAQKKSGPFGSEWLRCPLRAARKISGRGDARSGSKINIGWSAARVSPLPARRLQCFRYMESRAQELHNDGRPVGALLSVRGGTTSCQELLSGSTKCPVCTDLGLPASHRMGSPTCKPPTRKEGRTGGKVRARRRQGRVGEKENDTAVNWTYDGQKRRRRSRTRRLRGKPPGKGYEGERERKKNRRTTAPAVQS